MPEYLTRCGLIPGGPCRAKSGATDERLRVRLELPSILRRMRVRPDVGGTTHHHLRRSHQRVPRRDLNPPYPRHQRRRPPQRQRTSVAPRPPPTPRNCRLTPEPSPPQCTPTHSRRHPQASNHDAAQRRHCHGTARRAKMATWRVDQAHASLAAVHADGADTRQRLDHLEARDRSLHDLAHPETHGVGLDDLDRDLLPRSSGSSTSPPPSPPGPTGDQFPPPPWPRPSPSSPTWPELRRWSRATLKRSTARTGANCSSSPPTCSARVASTSTRSTDQDSSGSPKPWHRTLSRKATAA